ncbi:MAG TPA: hypothetical protein VF815_04360 [Myxococcaceae bacterium]
MDPRQTGSILALVAVLAAGGCIISQDEAAGRACTFDAECPEAYACAGPEGLRFCELIYPPRPASTADAGTPDAGVVPTYCADVQPILAATCVSSCHGADTSGSGQTDFRLDYYEPGAGQVKGAKQMAARIKVRAFDQRTMPPLDSPMPSDAQRAVLARWVTAGAPFCADGGVPDAGGN